MDDIDNLRIFDVKLCVQLLSLDFTKLISCFILLSCVSLELMVRTGTLNFYLMTVNKVSEYCKKLPVT